MMAVEEEDPELTSSHRQSKTPCNGSHSKKSLETGRTDLPQLKIQREGHTEKGKSNRDMVVNQTLSVATHKWEGY